MADDCQKRSAKNTVSKNLQQQILPVRDSGESQQAGMPILPAPAEVADAPC
jgi:hypothetical protein